MKYGKSYTQTSFGQFLPSSPWDSWNSQQGKENVGIFFFFHASWAYLHSANHSHDSWAGFWKKNMISALMNQILNIEWALLCTLLIISFTCCHRIFLKAFSPLATAQKVEEEEREASPLHRLLPNLFSAQDCKALENALRVWDLFGLQKNWEPQGTGIKDF